MSSKITFLSALLVFMKVARCLAVELCPDTICQVPAKNSMTVLSPVPPTAIKAVAQGARLNTLAGKSIAIVGGSFMANVTHPELKRLILKEYPSAKIYVLSEIGSAGPYPRPGVVRRQKDEFVRKLQELKIDAVISGNGGCGLCTPKETGSCIAAEMLGIPSVMITAPGFTTQARNTAGTFGVGILRIAEYPGSFAVHTREELLKNTRDILYPQIKQALLEPLSDKERVSLTTPAEVSGSVSELQQQFIELGWSDGLPVVLPTREGVDEFLKFTDLPADFSLGKLPPAQREVNVLHIAVNGVMSGCPPEFMPILIAMVKAMRDGDFRRPLTSTHAWTPYCILNGPLARQLGFDTGQGEINAIKNAQLGRFINLAMSNLGGYRVKENRMGTFGYLMPWCLVEDEAAALQIKWRPYHMQQGFRLNDSTITMTSAINWGNNLVPATSDGKRIKDMMAWDAVEKSQMAVGSGMPRVYRVFLLTPGVAQVLAKAYPSKEALEKELIEAARIPVWQRAFANYWGNPGSAFNTQEYSLQRHKHRIARTEHAEVTATPPWLEWCNSKEIETVPAMEAGKTIIVVTGDPARNKEMCLPGGGSVTLRIELPRQWDKLMAERGYEPLSAYYLSQRR